MKNQNMAPLDFLKFLKNCKCLVGNSSVGIRECAYLGVPVVNIGSRQNGRERADNVIDVDYKKSEIQNAIKKQIQNGVYPKNKIYGNGDAGLRIAKLLTQVPLTFQKVLNY